MGAAEHAVHEETLHALADCRKDIFLVLELALALFHFAAQIRTGIQPEAVVRLVQIVQPITQPAKRILEQVHLMARNGHTQDDALEIDAA